ncbi:SPOR domain-containing protein [Robiginitalea sp. IMCC44478]|uniref:HU domain-containing protein n=1 Tax=Robiginitalea sp. IMCC44478 TaxID=3459122 RepID=UPI004042D85B
MGIENHISSLLYRYQCVVMPTFGAFLTQIKPAFLQKDSNSFFPPRKQLSFNIQLNSNDGLLASHIAEIEKLSYEEALTAIEEQAKSWMKTIRAEGKLELADLGTFKLNHEGKILFIPEEKINYLTAAFGLSPVIASPVSREVMKEEVEALESEIPFIITPERRASSGIRPLLKYAAVVFLSVAAGISGYMFYQQKGYSDAMVRANAQEEVSRNIQEATFFKSHPLELPSITVEIAHKQKGNHHIIAGAFRFRENADKKIAQLKAKGYNARYLGANAYGLHQVTYGSYSNPAEALQQLREIKRTESPDAWLLSER